MKQLRIELTDEEYEKLVRLKGSKSWKDFIVGTLLKLQNPIDIAIDKVNEVMDYIKPLIEDEKVRTIIELNRVALVRLLLGDNDKAREFFRQIANML